MFLSNDQTAIRDLARDFAANEIIPYAAGWDRDEHTPTDTLEKMSSLGLMSVCVPPELGGAGADFISYVSAMEEIAYGDAGISNLMAVTNSPVASALLAYGTPEQHERFVRPIAQDAKRGAFLLSEPQVGSDAGGLRTRATRRADRYVINGTKNFITAGSTAHFGLVFAVTDPSRGKNGISCFVVSPTQAGYVVAKNEQKLGHRSCDTCQIFLEDLEVPVSSMLGEEGRGLKIALSGLGTGRMSVAAQAVGVAQAALDASIAYSRERHAFGKPISEHQGVGFQLAEMATKIEVARQAYLHAAALKDAGKPFIKEASIAKLFSSQIVEQVTSAAIQIHGGYGYLSDYPVEKYFRDMKVFSIYDGTSEIQKMLILRELMKSGNHAFQ